MTEPTPDEQTAPEPEPDELDDTGFDPRARETLAKLRKENHSLRSRLRSTEDDLGVAAARLAAHHRREIERIAAATLIDPTDIWTAQPDVSAFVDDDFNDIVSDKVIESAKALIAQKPHLAKPPSGPPPTDRPIEGLRAGASPPEEPAPKPSWATAIRGAGA